jgi:NAD(P)-dependent dehydrogenase (short-subunit alcohol dehydrogenase family)
MAVDEPAKQYGLDREVFIRMRDEAVPMRRMGEAWDVAWAAVFLASDGARYITGVVLSLRRWRKSSERLDRAPRAGRHPPRQDDARLLPCDRTKAA